MRTYDQTSSLFWLLISAYVMIESLRMGIGSLREPGMGFMTFGTSLLLGLFSLILFAQACWRREESAAKPQPSGTFWWRVLLVLIALAVYSGILPTAGYLISTFILMNFLYWLLKKSSWWWVIVSSFLTTIITYYVFSKWLNCQFPDGLFGL
jgi:putative tricarboxylic transport membrane protein